MTQVTEIGAPWNEPDTIKVPVTISITCSKDTTLDLLPGYTEEDLYEAARDQIYNPVSVMEYLAKRQSTEWAKDLYTGWIEDEFVVVE